jgi:hypothetical protein
MGLFIDGVDTTIRSSVVRDTRGRESDQLFGRGVQFDCSAALSRCGSLAVDRSVVTGNRDQGINALGGMVAITASVIRDTVASPSISFSGQGVFAGCDLDLSDCGTLTLDQSVVSGNQTHGVFALGAELAITRSVIKDTLPHAGDQLNGVGVMSQCYPALSACGSFFVDQSTVLRSHSLGIVAAGVETSISSVVVRDTVPQLLDQRYGWGIAAQCHPVIESCERFELQNSLVAGSHRAGISVSGIPASLQNVVVTDTRAVQDPPTATSYGYGQGIWAYCAMDISACATIEMTACLVDSSHAAGVASYGHSGSLQSSKIVAVLPRPQDGRYGFGLQVSGIVGAPDTLFHANQSLIQDASMAGINYQQASGTLSETVVRGGDFALVWGGWPTPPADGGGNVLEGLLTNGISHQELEPSPAPDPVIPTMP